ncbi:hypothetical protein BT69DRAFT_1332151 [Atractiella rhizophila]|nr:hypothetical protein BT69DRAFT_1332151 [Atractiella rhizophila]
MLSTNSTLAPSSSLYRAKGAIFAIFSDDDLLGQQSVPQRSFEPASSKPIRKAKGVLGERQTSSGSEVKVFLDSGASFLKAERKGDGVETGVDDLVSGLSFVEINDDSNKENASMFPPVVSGKKKSALTSKAPSMKKKGERNPLSSKPIITSEKPKSKAPLTSKSVASTEKRSKPKKTLTSSNGICTGTLVEKEFPWHLNPGLKDEKDEMEELLRAEKEMFEMKAQRAKDANRIAKELTESPLAEITKAYTGSGAFKVLCEDDPETVPLSIPSPLHSSESQSSAVSVLSASDSDTPTFPTKTTSKLPPRVLKTKEGTNMKVKESGGLKVKEGRVALKSKSENGKWVTKKAEGKVHSKSKDAIDTENGAPRKLEGRRPLGQKSTNPLRQGPYGVPVKQSEKKRWV